MAKAEKKPDTGKLVLLALLTAITAVLQLLGTFVRFGPFEIALVLVPIVVGAAVIGVRSGAWLGAVFGFVVLFSPNTMVFMQFNVIGTVLIVLIKGIAAGFAAGAVYNLIKKKNQYIAVLAAAIVAPIVNTGIFVLGCYIFFQDLLLRIAESSGIAGNVTSFIFISLVGVNFIIEFIVNVVLSGVIVRIINIWQNRKPA